MLLPGDILLRGNPLYKWMRLGFILNIKRSDQENKYISKVNSRNTRTRCHMFKIHNSDSRAMISFCSVVNRVPWHRFQANIYLFKVNNIYVRIRCGICSMLTMNSRERRQWHRPDVFIDNVLFQHVSPYIPVFLLLTLGMYLFARLDEYNTA